MFSAWIGVYVQITIAQIIYRADGLFQYRLVIQCSDTSIHRDTLT